MAAFSKQKSASGKKWNSFNRVPRMSNSQQQQQQIMKVSREIRRQKLSLKKSRQLDYY